MARDGVLILTARLREAHAATTKGRAVQFHPRYCPEAIGQPFSVWDTSHELSVIRETGSPYRLAEFRHAADALFMQEALNAAPSLLDAIDALAAEVTRLREAGQEAALQVLASDGQAQEALDRALAAEARVKELEGFADARHRSFPDVGDARPMPPMGDELMIAGLSGGDARFVAIQLAEKGMTLTDWRSKAVEWLNDAHRDYMISKGQDPDKYASTFSLAARAILEGKQ